MLSVLLMLFLIKSSVLWLRDRVEFRGFGAFSVRKRSPRAAKNPRTGEQVDVEERLIPHFKTGKQLHELLNNN